MVAVKGYEGLYEVSDFGRVRSKRDKTRIRDRREKIMKQKVDTGGYFRVNLYKNNICHSFLVSRLVAEAFIPNPNNLPHVGHDDDDPTNNHVTNLYWTNPKENNRHNGKLERLQQAHNEKIKVIAEKLAVKVIATNIESGERFVFNSMQETKKHGFCPSKVSLCVNGKRNRHKGFMWERVNYGNFR